MELILKDTQEVIKISKSVFGCKFNKFLVHQVLKSYSSSQRKGTKAQKSRAEVSGSGKKPWRQKGTGRARVGSIRSPIWRSGGVTFAAKPKSYKKKINKKMYRGALKCIFSELIKKKKLIVLKKFNIDYPKTKKLLQELKILNLTNALIIQKILDKNILLASRNLYKVTAISLKFLHPLILLHHSYVLITLKALKNIEEKLL
ncbi:50S ribosomal protein L4 [Buchnera aphidicola (Periphyllus testudinaceus)]|uniref:50S ribosomal protein L4 n=1 Tax=Buchnera aphidicola TaxID=9 RepID=UPI0034646CA4